MASSSHVLARAKNDFGDLPMTATQINGLAGVIIDLSQDNRTILIWLNDQWHIAHGTYIGHWGTVANIDELRERLAQISAN
jgi:hypothetical protein